MNDNTGEKDKQQILDLNKIQELQQQFESERDWDQFHTPKNLAMALSVEVSELCEIFQWLTPEQSMRIGEDLEKKESIADELSDILFYTIRLAAKLDVGLPEAFESKMKKNAEKYPVHLSKGHAKKYNEL